MAFDANVIIVSKEYSVELEQTILRDAGNVLGHFNIVIDNIIDMKEYENLTSSKEINRYIRVKKNVMAEQNKKAYELVKVGTTRLQAFDTFSSAKCAFFSVSNITIKDKEYSVIWFSFHTRLYKAFPEFGDFSINLAKVLSGSLRAECFLLGATSLSRNSDKFAMYVNGTERHKLSSKGALTEVRNLYGIDINEVMINIDKNMAILYSPKDYKEVKQELKDQKLRYKQWEDNKDSLKKNDNGIAIENKEDGTDFMVVFEKENEIILKTIRNKLSLVEETLRLEPIGNVIFFKLDDRGSSIKDIPLNETDFGRKV